MENKQALQAFQDDSDSFVQCAMCYPGLAERVLQALRVLVDQNIDSSVPALIVCRDAALALHRMAIEIGFPVAAAYYATVYDRYSRLILSYYV